MTYIIFSFKRFKNVREFVNVTRQSGGETVEQMLDSCNHGAVVAIFRAGDTMVLRQDFVFRNILIPSLLFLLKAPTGKIELKRRTEERRR